MAHVAAFSAWPFSPYRSVPGKYDAHLHTDPYPSLQTIIGIDSRIAGVIITGAQMHITHQFVIFPAHDQNHLGVSFVTDNAVDHDRTRFLQYIGDFNIGFLIETRTQFNDCGDFLAITSSFSQHLDNFRIWPTTV